MQSEQRSTYTTSTGYVPVKQRSLDVDWRTNKLLGSGLYVCAYVLVFVYGWIEVSGGRSRGRLHP